jgi:hypothetical protein
MSLGSTQPLVKMSTRNIPGGKGGRCVRLTTSPTSCAECHEIWEPKPPGTLWATPGLLRDSFNFHLFNMATLSQRRSIVFFDDFLSFTLLIILISQTMPIGKWSYLLQQVAGCSNINYSLLQNKFQCLGMSKGRRPVSRNSNETSGRWATYEIY